MISALFMGLGASRVEQVPPARPRDDGANVVLLPDAVWSTKGRKRAPVTMAAQKRASAKRRNVTRNRKAHK